MNLYLDDDSLHGVLFRELKSAGHDVVRSSDVGLEGESDPVHLARAIQEQRTLYTGNRSDFSEPHSLVLVSQGHHFGIIAVSRENNPRRDLTTRGIINARRKLEAANIDLQDELIDLNVWR